MKRRSIILLDSAKQDLRKLVEWLAREVSTTVARRYVDKVMARIRTLRIAAERGTIRDAHRGLRIIGIQPNTSILFSVDARHVYILRVLHGGQQPDLDEDQAQDET